MLANKTHQASRELQQARSKKPKACYDCKARDLPPLQPGDKVLINPLQGREWIEGSVAGRIDGRLYQVSRHDGVILRQSQCHLRVWKGHKGMDEQHQWLRVNREHAEDLASEESWREDKEDNNVEDETDDDDRKETASQLTQLTQPANTTMRRPG